MQEWMSVLDQFHNDYSSAVEQWKQLPPPKPSRKERMAMQSAAQQETTTNEEEQQDLAQKPNATEPL